MASPETPTKLRALVVEDDVQLQGVYTKLLEHANFTVQTVKDGLSAVDSFKKDPPALLVVDFLLPRLDGVKVVEQVMAVKKIPVIFVSAIMRDPVISSKLRAMGVHWILEKPFRVENLRKAFKEAIDAAIAAQPKV
jgi:DNA-binding response OmpR family regulator